MTTLNQVVILACCYSLLFLLCLWVYKMGSESLIAIKTANGNWKLLHMRHAGGIVIMVLIPALLLPDLPKHLLIWPAPVDLLQAITLLNTGFILLALIKNHLAALPTGQMNADKSSLLQAAIHLVLRSFFLVSYEWFFRGCILFSCVHLVGTTPAIAINLGIYAFIHSFNGKKELYGSIPFGLMLCVFTLWYQSVWPAILLHLLLSLPYETVVLHSLLKKPNALL